MTTTPSLTNNARSMLFIGIDPGVGGGLAIVASDGTMWGVSKMPATEQGLVDVLENVKAFAAKTNVPVSALLERVWSVPIQGHVGAFTFGMSYGCIRGVLTALRIPFGIVLPRGWQGPMGVFYPPKSKDTVKKNISKARAQFLFKQIPVTHAVADAMLLAEFHRRTYVDGAATQPAEKKEEHGKATRTEEKGQGATAGKEGRGQKQRQTGEGKEAAAQTAAGAPGHGARPVQRARRRV